MVERENTGLFSSCCLCVSCWKVEFSEPLLWLCAGPGRREWVCAGHGAARGAANHQHVRWDCHRSAPATARGRPLWWPVEDKVRQNQLSHKCFPSMLEKLVWFRLCVAPQKNADTSCEAKTIVSFCLLIWVWCLTALESAKPCQAGSGFLLPAEHSCWIINSSSDSEMHFQGSWCGNI